MNAQRYRWASVLATLVLFQGAWLSCVVGAAQGAPGIGIAIVSIVIGVKLLSSENRSADLRLIALAMALGVVWDSALGAGGAVQYAASGAFKPLAPLWIVSLWALFATVLRTDLRWLHERRLAAALLGAVGGAASYASAARLGAATFPNPMLALAIIAAGWACMTPLLADAARRLSRGDGGTVAAREAGGDSLAGGER